MAGVPTHPWADFSEAPLLTATFPATGTEQEVTDYCELLLGYYQENPGPIVWVADCSAVTAAPAPVRKTFAEFEARFSKLPGFDHRGTAFVITKTFVRGLVTAVFWLSPPQYPHEIFGDIESARAWALRRV